MAKHCLTDLRNGRSFPTFRNCPSEDVVDERYYDTFDGFRYFQSRHWCLLGEITSVFFLLGRLRLTLKDKEGREFGAHYYTDHAGSEVDQKMLKEGYTVAIMYAHVRQFMDGSVGIRVEKPESVKFIPCSLGELLAMNDRLHATVKNGETRCHACGARPEKLSKCARCEMFSYCNKECQVDGWKNKGHKGDCKVLKDQDIQRLFTAVNFDRFDSDGVVFPVQLYEERKRITSSRKCS